MNESWIPDILNAIYQASEAIMNIYDEGFEVIRKSDDSPVTMADKQSNMIMTKALERTGVMIVSEEEKHPDYLDRKDQAIWLLDPLDGTKDFIKKSNEFCICLALIEDHQPIFGIIANPVKREIIMGGTNMQARLFNYGAKDPLSEEYMLPKVQDESIHNVIYSRTSYTPRIDALMEKVENKHGACGRILKGSALKFFDLVTDNAQVYIRLWPTMEWDIAAGHAIYASLGGEVVEFTTFASLHYNKENLYNPQFIAKPKNLKLHD